LLCYFLRCDGYLSPPTQPKPPIRHLSLARLNGFGVCGTEFLIGYPHQCRSFSPKTTKRMGAITACNLYREGRHSIEYNFIFVMPQYGMAPAKNARTNRINLTIIRPRCRDRRIGARLVSGPANPQ